VMRIQ